MSEQINPAFWIDAIRVAMHTTDCAAKQRTLANAADHLERYIIQIREDHVRTLEALNAALLSRHAERST